MIQTILQWGYMKLQLNIKTFIISAFILSVSVIMVSCEKNDYQIKNDPLYSNSVYSFNENLTIDDWEAMLESLGYNDSLANTLIFVTSSIHCSTCLQELSIWNDLVINNKLYINNAVLIVIEKFENRYQNFLVNNKLVIPSIQDSSAILIENNFIPRLPVKIYFDNNGNPDRIHTLGGDEYLREFASDLTQLDEHPFLNQP